MRLTRGLRLNRPARRYAARFYCLVRYGHSHAHAEDWWPNLRLVKAVGEGKAGRIVYRGRAIAPVTAYPRSLEGISELIVVGSGPSLASQAVDRVPIESALLVNGAIHLLNNSGRRPFGVVIEDERFVWRHWQALFCTVPPQTDCYFSTSVIRALCEISPEWLASQSVHHLDFVHRPHGNKRPDGLRLRSLPFLRWSDDGKAAISLSPESGLMPAGSVAGSAAQLALSLAPPRIGLAGIDLTNTSRPRFYESDADKAMSRIDAASERILATFSIIRDECARRGIVLENYSPVSRLAEIGVPYVSRLEG
jgi:hypothetical protein